MSRRTLIVLGCLATLYSVWGSTYLAMRVAATSLPPSSMAGARFLVAGTALWVLMRVRGTAEASRAELRGAVIAGVLMPGIGIGCAALSASRVSSAVVALAFGAVPLWTVLLDRLLSRVLRTKREPLGRLEMLGLALGLVGVGILGTRGALRADPGAALLLFFATLSYACGCVAARRLPQPPGSSASALQMIVGGALQLAFGLLRGEHWPKNSPPAAWLALAWLVVAGSMLGYSAFGWLMRNVRPALATSYAFVNPVVAMFFGAALGAEVIGAVEIFAAAAIVSAVALLLGGAHLAGAFRRARASHPPSPPPTVAPAA